MHNLIATNIDVWTAALENKSAAGRGTNNKQTAYGIKKLRELILELAVRGKLVPQDPNDEPASVLLEKIADEKARLVKEGKIKKQKALPEIGEDEKPFELPEGWEWARFGNLAQHNAGKTLDKGRNTGKLRNYITTSNLYWGRFELSDLRQMPIQDEELEKCQARKGDLLICEGGEAGRAAVWSFDDDICFQNHVHRARFFFEIDPYYIYRVFEKLDATGEINKYRKGVGITNMSGKALSSIPIPIPPIIEQHRIVAKVDELMALCDQLEQQQTDSIAAHQTLVETLLKTLTDSENAEQLAQNWAVLSEHFDTLFTTDHSIAQLKQTILQLAVMGKLVPQDPNDKPASVLLEKIAEEKACLVKEGKIKKQKALPEIGEDEKPFDLPSMWELARFSEYATEISTGPFGTMIHKQDYINGGVPLINPSHMIDSRIIEDSKVSINKEKAGELSSYKLSDGDIVMARRGELGRCALVTSREQGWLCGTGSFVLKFNEKVCRRFVLMLFKSEHTRSYLAGKSVGSTMTNLNHGILNAMPIGIPPLEEQYRIVAKVDELMALCDQLQAQINKAQTTQIHLADAIVEQAIA